MGKRGCEGMDDDMSEVRGGEDKEEEEREKRKINEGKKGEKKRGREKTR